MEAPSVRGSVPCAWCSPPEGVVRAEAHSRIIPRRLRWTMSGIGPVTSRYSVNFFQTCSTNHWITLLAGGLFESSSEVTVMVSPTELSSLAGVRSATIFMHCRSYQCGSRSPGSSCGNGIVKSTTTSLSMILGWMVVMKPPS